MTQHHPTEEYLLHHAAGALPEGQALLVAAHLTFCPGCRDAVREAEAVGGAFLEESAGEPGDIGAALARFPFDDPAPEAAPAAVLMPADADIPAPLQPYIGPRLAGIRWRTFWPGMQTVRLKCDGDAADASLLRLAPGKGMPIHTHGGDELTIVLGGSYTDETGRYGVGDVALGDPALTHRPVADEGDHCVCFTVVDAPLKFASPLARLAARFLLR